MIDITVPKSKNTEAGAVEVFVPNSIAHQVGGQVVLASVDFDDESMPQTDEVDDIASTGCLAAKMKSERPPRSEVIPDFHLQQR